MKEGDFPTMGSVPAVKQSCWNNNKTAVHVGTNEAVIMKADMPPAFRKRAPVVKETMTKQYTHDYFDSDKEESEEEEEPVEEEIIHKMRDQKDEIW